MNHNIKVGDSFFLDPQHSREKPFYDYVTRVGNKYFYTKKGLQFELGTFKNTSKTGYYYQFYKTEQEYLDALSKKSLWREIVNKYSYNAPPCSLENLKVAIDLLENSES